MRLIVKTLFLFAIIITFPGCLQTNNSTETVNEIIEKQENTETPKDKENKYRETSLDMSDWKIYKNEDLGIKLKQPSDWIHVTPEYPQKNNILLITHDNGRDSTQLIISKYNLTLEESLEAAPPSRSLFDTLGKIEEMTINNKVVTKQTLDYKNNDCTKVKYFHEISNTTTGVVEISGLCPTHPQGYDEVKQAVAKSVEFISVLK